MRILFFGHPGYGGAVLEQLVSRTDVQVVAVVHASHDNWHNLRHTLRRRFGTWKRVAKNVKKIWRNLPTKGQASYAHPHTFSPVDPEVVARRSGIPLIDASQLQKPELVERLRALEVEVLLVASFGELIPQNVLGVATKAAINMHPGLLPKHRGGFPEYCALIEGDEIAGITCHLMTAKFDTGAILLQRAIPIGDDDLLQLKQRMIQLGASMIHELIDELDLLLAGSTPQRDDEATTCRYPRGYNVLDPAEPTGVITRKVRASAGENYEPYRVSKSGRKVYVLHLSEQQGRGFPLQCSDGTVWVDVIRYKRRIYTDDFPDIL